jgi:predicted alpha/beta superfamily hydrolase
MTGGVHMKQLLLLGVVAAILSPGSVWSDAGRTAPADISLLQGISDTRYHRLESKQTNHEYHVFVRLPEGYASEENIGLPTVYLLDGGITYPLLAGYYRYLSFLGEEIPEAILVGIAYGTDDWENGNTRGTDFTAASAEREHYGGAPRFQKMLSEELLPLIERTYRSSADRRIIFGQSLGGQFVLFTALTQPRLFWGHIASNPALHRNLPFFLKTHGNSQLDRGRSRLFVGSGTLDDSRFHEPAQKWIKHWSAVKATPWDLKTVDLEGHSHMSAPPASFRQGMRWLFSEKPGTIPPGLAASF